MKISNKIYIHKDELQTLGEGIPERILNELTYDNPEFFMKMNLGLSTWGTPEKIRTCWMKGDYLEVMRGESLKIKKFIKGLEYNFDHPDHPINIKYINNDFPLDNYQEGAIQAVKSTRQGIIHAVTSAGKSLIIVKSIAEVGQRTLIVVHRKILMKQLLEDIDKYIRNEKGEKIKVGVFGDGSKTIGDITIGIDKTLFKNGKDIINAFGMVILDECHLAPANTIYSLINGINAKYRFGFSGTLKRKDQKEFLIYSTFGRIIATISKDQLLEKGRVVPVQVKILESETQFNWDDVVSGLTDQGEKNPTMKARHLQEQTISHDPGRNDLILDLVKRLEGKTIVLSRYVEPCYKLKDALMAKYGIESAIITGRDSKEAMMSYDLMKRGNMKVIFATIGCVSTGVSISDLDNIVLISPIYSNELLLHQIRGRLMRISEGKTHGTLYFIYDPYIFPPYKLKRFLSIMKN